MSELFKPPQEYLIPALLLLSFLVSFLLAVTVSLPKAVVMLNNCCWFFVFVFFFYRYLGIKAVLSEQAPSQVK